MGQMTNPATSRKGRPPVERTRVVTTLRRQIVSGRLRPEQRLPATLELEKQFRTNTRTIEEAVRELRNDGFLESQPRRGTFVVPHPPCLANVAVVYPHRLDSSHRDVTFWRVLANLAKRNSCAPQHRFVVYTGLNGHMDEPDYRRLLHDVRAHKLAGILFASSPHLLLKTPLFAEIMARPELPRVAFMSHATHPGIPVVWGDEDGYFEQALTFFQAQGRRRLAVLGAASQENREALLPGEANLAATAAKHGIEVRPYWIQGMSHALAPRARPLAQLLMHGPRNDRPDALLILDDSLVEAATAGVADAGVKMPDELTVIGHANFPEPPFSAVPIARLGYDVQEVLDRCLEIMDRQRRGVPVPEATQVAATFADDRAVRRRKSAA
jgi:DNA-binding LacI/PurR family transcriptional regulator